jgi:hypothetical protein
MVGDSPEDVVEGAARAAGIERAFSSTVTAATRSSTTASPNLFAVPAALGLGG